LSAILISKFIYCELSSRKGNRRTF
jgi:hypothetical protein